MAPAADLFALPRLPRPAQEAERHLACLHALLVDGLVGTPLAMQPTCNSADVQGSAWPAGELGRLAADAPPGSPSTSQLSERSFLSLPLAAADMAACPAAQPRLAPAAQARLALLAIPGSLLFDLQAQVREAGGQLLA